MYKSSMTYTNSSGNIVYALVDPFTNAIRYVGKSSYGLSRAKAHAQPRQLARNVNPHKCNWIRALKERGVRPTISVLEECADESDLSKTEVKWIKHFNNLGCSLTNITTGGDGRPGYEMPNVTKQLISDRKKGRIVSQEERENNSRAHGCKPFTDQYGTVYKTVNGAARELGIAPSDISRVLRNVRGRTSAKGFEFKFIE